MKTYLPVITSIRSRLAGIFCATAACLFAWAGLSSSASAQNLVFHYEFNDTSSDASSSTTASDSSGNGYNLGFQGAASPGEAGGRQGVLNLNATAQANPDAAIATGFSDLPAPLTQYTITGWFYRAPGSSALGGTILSLGSDGSRAFSITVLNANGQLDINPVAGGRTVETVTSADLAATGQWTFFAITIDSTLTGGSNWTNAVKLYVGDDKTASSLARVTNKGLIGSGTLSQFAITDFDSIALGNGYNSVVGNQGSPNRALYSGISLDDIRLYDGVLDETALNTVRLQSVATPVPEPSASAVLAGSVVMIFSLLAAWRSAGENC
ncbi:MAG: LamG domain-containing protein [Opitutaceae bacterium]|jgi:hypothetical protein|nr:LamG domain-containing protein [Opitutaceae bacterium]